MSKKVKYILWTLNCLFLFSFTFYGQTPGKEEFFKPIDKKIVVSESNKSPEELKADSSRVSFEVALAKDEFLLSEPIIFRCRFSNKTNENLEIYVPNLVNQLGVKAQSNEGSDINRKLFSRYINKPSGIQMLKPGEFIEEVIMFEPDSELFKSVEKYNVQFFLSRQNEVKWSNPASFVVKAPEGIDKEAYDFLRSDISSEGELFSLREKDSKTTQALLETFINKFNSSIYYEYAVLALSNLYKETRQFERAKRELIKIKDSQNSLLGEIARKEFAGIESSGL